MKLITLEKDYSIKLSSNINNYLNPDYVFLPMPNDYKLNVRNQEVIKKEQILLTNNQDFIYSPISGKVVGTKKCLLPSGNVEKCIVIENDYKEKSVKRKSLFKDIKEVNQFQFQKELRDNTFFNSFEIIRNINAIIDTKKPIKNLIVNGIEDEPYLATRLFVMQKNVNEILDVLNFFNRILNICNTIIVLKDNDRESIEAYNNILGTYPEIKLELMPDFYLIGKNKNLLKKLHLNTEETLIVNPDDLLLIYNLFFRNRLVTEKYITITGNAVANPCVINVKIGSLIGDIIKENIELNNSKEIIYVVNGLMAGLEVDVNALIVTQDLNGIVINYKEDYETTECINCGNCYKICPVGINPKEALHGEKPKECLNCGLCTYICPAYINLKQYLGGNHNEK